MDGIVQYWPAAAMALLSLFVTPKEKPVWKIIKDLIVPSTTDAPADPKNILSMIPVLLKRLEQKKPPIDEDPSTPDKPVTNTPEDLVELLVDMLSKPEPPEDVLDPSDDMDVDDLVSCANAVAAKYPNHDISVSVTDGEVTVSKVKRAEQK